MALNKTAVQAQSHAINRIVDKAYVDLCEGGITEAHFNKILDNCQDESRRIRDADKVRLKAMSMANLGDSAEQNRDGFDNPTDLDEMTTSKAGFRGLLDKHGKNPYAVSPLHASAEEWQSLHKACESQLPSYAIGLKAFGAGGGGFAGQARMKTPIFSVEGTPGSLLPPELIPSAFPLKYEPTRVFSHLPGMPMTSQWIQYLQHTANTNPAAVTAEVAAVPDLGMAFTPKTAVAEKIGATAAISRELVDDFSDFVGMIPAEMAKALFDAESNFVLNNATYGILATSGIVLVNAAGGAWPAGPQTGIDALLDGINQIRVATAAFSEADLLIIHPQTWLGIRTVRTTVGSFVLEQFKPMDVLGENLDNFFGVPVVQTTTCPQGTAIIMNKEDAIIGLTRMGPELAINTTSDNVFATFAWQWRVIERIGVAIPRPSAICVVENLPSYAVGGS